jgi:hypothetical protein
MGPNEIVHVAIVPSGRLETDLIKQVANIISKDPYGTRLLLAGMVPRIVAQYDTTQAAELAAQHLRSLGLLTMVCNDSELRKPCQGFKAISMAFEGRTILFRDKTGQTRRMGLGEVFLIIRGNIQTYMETESITTDTKFSLGATIMTGGIPIFRKVQTKTKDKSIRTEGFLRFYGWTSPEPSVEILQHDFDYSFLGSETVISTLINFNNLVARIRGTLPETIVDERLMNPFRVDIYTATPQESIEINCKLIYMQYQALSDHYSSA